MSLISDAIDTLVQAIGSGVESLYSWGCEAWNDGLSKVYDVIYKTPREWNAGAYSTAVEIANTLLPTALALLSLVFVMGLFRDTANFMERRTPMTIGKAFLRYVLSVAGCNLIVGNFSNGKSILETIDAIVYGIVHMIGRRTGVPGQLSGTLPDEVKTWVGEKVLIEGTSNFGLEVAIMLVTLIFALAGLIATFALWLIVFNRFFKIYILVAISPLPMAFFGSESTQRTGIGFIKTYVVSLAEIVVIVIALWLYSGFVGGIESILATGNYFAFLAKQALMMYLLIATIKGAETLLKEVAS